MSIEAIRILSYNPHFLAKLVQSLLAGYAKPCGINTIYLSMPIIMHGPSRKKLLTAKSSSRLDSLYGKPLPISDSLSISGRSQLAGYHDRYNLLQPYTRQAVIVAINNHDIVINDQFLLSCKNKLNYKTVPRSMAPWIRSAYYLGIVLSTASAEQISYYMGVDHL